MKVRYVAALMAGTLVFGLVAGSVVTGVAAPAPERAATTTSAGAAGLGLRLGVAMREAGGRLADIVAKLTGSDVEDVLAQRAKGESFADIAAEDGIDAGAVVDEALKVRTSLLDERVKAGAITQEQADAALARMKDRLTERVDSTEACTGGGGAGRGMGGGMGGGGGRGRGGMGGCGGACTQDATVTQ
jgi:hypothetical protein